MTKLEEGVIIEFFGQTMDSGIYRLTFANGDTYVGKSLHLRVRWRQHYDKINKGSAAKNMMEAYYMSGKKLPDTEVLLECHPDVLDVYENYFINALEPKLNTQIPDLKTENEQWALIRHMEAGSAIFSVPTMLLALEEINSERCNLSERLEEIRAEYSDLDELWDNRAARDNRARADYCLAVDRYKEVVESLEKLRGWQRRVLKANWWDRLWMSW